jgi:putative transposase
METDTIAVTHHTLRANGIRQHLRVNNRAENSHQPTRRRERQMCGFRDARRTQAFLSCFGPIR